MHEAFSHVPILLVDFILVLVFSLLIGLEQGRHFKDEDRITFGSDRTFTFIGLLGFILSLLHIPLYFVAGLICLSALLTVFYFLKMQKGLGHGLTSIMLALTVYSMPLVVLNQPIWLALTLYVLLLLLAELKDFFQTFSSKLDKEEFLTLGKFLLMAGVILPALPDSDISKYMPVSPYKIWLGIVVVSGISYFSYLLKKYVFPNGGLMISGILGGLYSSTATTFVMARSSKSEEVPANQYAAAILAATSMMFVRIFVFMIIFAPTVVPIVWPYFLVLFVVSVIVTAVTYRLKTTATPSPQPNVTHTAGNPLEFKIAIVFAVLYIVFTIATHYTLEYFGNQGLTVLSFLVGFTDIYPFLLNIFQGHYNMTAMAIGIATMQAIISNNLVKAVYGMVLCDRNMRRMLCISFGVIIAVNLVVMVLMYLMK